MIKENALKYLGYLDNQVDSNTEILLNECLKELEQVTPKFMYQIYTLTHHPLTIKELNLTINYPDLIDLFDSCDRIVINCLYFGVTARSTVTLLFKNKFNENDCDGCLS